MSYDPPKQKELLFKFDTSGYTIPNFNDVKFNYPGVTRDLGMMITGAELQRDYLKSCNTYVIGYNKYNVQILKSQCVYGGIRDLEVYLMAEANFLNLDVYLKQGWKGDPLNLNFLTKGIGKEYSDVSFRTKSWYLGATVDLHNYLKQGFAGNTDLSAYLGTFFPGDIDLNNIIQGWKREASVRLYELIKGVASVVENFPAYIKPTINESRDLPTEVYKIWQHNQTDVSFETHGYAILELAKYIRAFNYVDLPVQVRSTYLKDLIGYLRAVEPADITASLMGWATDDITANIAYAKAPYDFGFNIYGIPSVNLPVAIQTRLGIDVPFDLLANITSYYFRDMGAYLRAIPALDLGAYIQAVGKVSNLNVRIYPKVVYVRTTLNISYLESSDLAATINYPCFGTGYRNLPATLISLNSLSLRATVFGTDGTNMKDLGISVNSGDHKVIDKIKVNSFDRSLPFTTLGLKRPTNREYDVVSNLTLKLKKLKTAGLFYTKDPAHMAENSAMRFIEEARTTYSTVDEYKVDRSEWSAYFVGTPYPPGSNLQYVTDDAAGTAAGTHDLHTNRTWYVHVDVKPKLPLSKISFIMDSPGYTYISPFVTQVKTNAEDAWTTVDSFTWSSAYVDHTLGVAGFDAPVGYIRIKVQHNGYHGTYVYDVSGYSTFTNDYASLVKQCYTFNEVPLSDEWDLKDRMIQEATPVARTGGDPLPIESFVAKSIVFDFANNWAGSGSMGVRSIEFKNDGALLPMTNNFTAYATSYNTGGGWTATAAMAFDTTLSKLQWESNRSWRAQTYNYTNQRLIIVFDELTEFDSIIVNNFHSWGGSVNQGVKDTKIYITNNDVTDVTYGAGIPGSYKLFDSQIREHLEIDAADDINVLLTTIYAANRCLYTHVAPVAYASSAVVSPAQIAEGALLDYFEYYFLRESGTHQPAVKLHAKNGENFVGFSVSADGELRYFTDRVWHTVGPVAISGNNNWFRIRADFDWDKKTMDIELDDITARSVYKHENIPFTTLTGDRCVGGGGFGSGDADSVGYNTDVNNSFNDNLGGGSRYGEGAWNNRGGDAYEFVGYSFNSPQVVKQLRYKSFDGSRTPNNFEIRAVEGEIKDYTGHDLLYTSNEDDAVWNDTAWRLFVLDNPENKAYNRIWLINYETTALYVHEIEVYCLFEEQDMNIQRADIACHNPNIVDSYWSVGWGGTDSRFYIDDVTFHKLEYRGIYEKDASQLPVVVNGVPITVDLGASIRAYVNRSYESVGYRERFITLKLNHDDVEEWRRYVELTFSDYARSYYYFSGNQRAYREFRDEHWVVKIEGYNLFNLPVGTERTKLRQKYIFNLSKYKSIDEAIKDMVDRVTLLPSQDLNFMVYGEAKKELDLNCIIETKASYKSNRVLGAIINVI